MCALEFARIGKLFEKMQTSSFGSDFSTHEFFGKMQLGKNMISSHTNAFFFSQKTWSFFDKPFKKFGENMLFHRKFNIFAVLGIKFNNSFMKRHGKKTLIQRTFMDNSLKFTKILKFQTFQIIIF